MDKEQATKKKKKKKKNPNRFEKEPNKTRDIK